MPQAPYAVDAYRNNFDVPLGRETIAVGTIDNDTRTIIGVNSRAPGYTNVDRAAANAMRDNLIVSDPEVMRSDNTGYKPNDAIYHAEATALMRAARSNGGSLYGRSLDIFVDRPMCDSCDQAIAVDHARTWLSHSLFQGCLRQTTHTAKRFLGIGLSP